MVDGGDTRRVVGAALAVLLLAVLVGLRVADRAAADGAHCRAHRADARERAGLVTGEGARTVVIGDSWSVGLGLEHLDASWPSRLSGRTRVHGFSGSGFSDRASGCGAVSFAERATDAVGDGADLVVVAGGLNDHDQTAGAVSRGFHALMRSLGGQRVVVVGPALAPAREDAVPGVDRLLARLSTSYGVPYIATSDLDLPYLEDDLHLTPEGHRAFGDAVADRLRDVQAARPRRD